MSDATRALDQQLRLVVLPALKEQGFEFDRRRTFRRAGPDGAIQIVNFQVGERSMEGQFTVNLGVYRPGDPIHDTKVELGKVMEHHCPSERRKRLGELRAPAFAGLRQVPVLGVLFGSVDRWWPISGAEQITRRSLEKVTKALVDQGLPWLERQ
ncbi:MAG TPA: DUF4304 domain-containing protein [Polaromonas sp.]|uniref:DUF4304 domain-containing protein n=1 Tax=Polaromonas sp. TaxID=1869339 RepID=UPI002D702962|nr:DUF4304 domain-containing protein [Polaromonas sp.]HYW55874.1 DUF4304 domain-containing protein [Polaromonas sp.]